MSEFEFDPEALRRIRRERGLSQHGLAAQVGISKISVSKMENGHHGPTVPTLATLARVLEVPMDELIRPVGRELVSA